MDAMADTQSASSAKAEPVLSDIPQDLAFLLESGVVESSEEAPSASVDGNGNAAADDGAGGAAESQEKSLAHYRAAVAAARAALEASRAKKSEHVDVPIATGDATATSASADTNMVVDSENAGDADIKQSAPMDAGTENKERENGDRSLDLVETLTASASVPPRKRRRVDPDGVSASSSSSEDSSDSDSDSSSDSDSDSDRSSSTETAAAAGRPPKGKKPAAQQERVEKLPAWANSKNNADSDGDDFDDYDDDEDGPKGASAARGPTTKNEIALSALTLNQPALEVIPASEPIRYLGRVSSIIGPVVVIEQDVRRPDGGKGKGPMMGMGGYDGESNGQVGHDVLDTGSLLLFENRKVCGTIFETFGSVFQPMYTLRFASPSDVPTLDMKPPKSKPVEEAVNAVLEAVLTEQVQAEDDDGDIDGAPLDFNVDGNDVSASILEVDGTITQPVSDACEVIQEVVEQTQPVEASEPIEAATSESDSAALPISAQLTTKSESEPHPVSDAASSSDNATAEVEAEPESAPPSTPMTVGTPIYYAPTRSNCVITSYLRKLKGSDASNLYDEEVAEEEMESYTGTGGPGPGLRHRDDMGSADTMMTSAMFSADSAARSSSSSAMPLPSSLPARPMFSYDFDNANDASTSAASATAAAGRRNMPAPYDEHAAVAHTLALPATPVVKQPVGDHSAAAVGGTSVPRPASSSRWDQRGQNNASSPQSRPHQHQHQQQQQQRQPQPASPAVAEQPQSDSAAHVAPHINPLFAQQFYTQTAYNNIPYAQQSAQYSQQSPTAHYPQQHHQQQQQLQHPLPLIPPQPQFHQQQQNWNAYYAQQGYAHPSASMGGNNNMSMAMAGYSHPSYGGQQMSQMQNYGQPQAQTQQQQQQQQQQNQQQQSGAGSYPFYSHQYQQ
ncbi:unnamed protein product [Tilletia laevis]|uniref:Uncharacterized protein n=2 Tax=Tilletia TaxID=13289 RepID=A0A9N8LKM6_9BASI|nr:unnamed protein product [Tilletia laevis]CAD6909338.1 unnamed protein product [Tilletia caries]CAD6926435.1 unnamed protein product [Tilletia caries]